MVAALPSAPNALSMSAASRMEDSKSPVNMLHCCPAAAEADCCSVQLWVRLRIDRDEDCGQVMPAQTGEAFASHVMVEEGEVSADIRDCRMVDLGELVSMEDKDLTVLATSPRMVSSQT